MDTKTLKDRIEDDLLRLCQELAQGKGAGIAAHLRSHAHFRTYSPFNRRAILLQRPQATSVMSKPAWEALGRSVREGAEPIFILAPMFFTQRTPDAAPDAPTPATLILNAPVPATPAAPTPLPFTSAQPQRPSGYHAVRVYAAEDTTGDPLRDRVDEPAAQISEETLNGLLGLCPYRVVWDDVDDVQIDSSVITVPRAASSQGAACLSILRGWALADWASHNPGSKHDERVRRSEAVLVAYAVGEALGWPNLAFTVSELQLMWGGKPRKLGNALTRIDKSAQRLLARLKPLAEAVSEEVAA